MDGLSGIYIFTIVNKLHFKRTFAVSASIFELDSVMKQELNIIATCSIDISNLSILSTLYRAYTPVRKEGIALNLQMFHYIRWFHVCFLKTDNVRFIN